MQHVGHDCCSLENAQNVIASEIQTHIDHARHTLGEGQQILEKLVGTYSLLLVHF